MKRTNILQFSSEMVSTYLVGSLRQNSWRKDISNQADIDMDCTLVHYIPLSDGFNSFV